jgi:hypothetical protein
MQKALRGRTVERNTFDEMVKRFGVGASRRQLLGGLIGSAAAALAGVALDGSNVEAKKGKGKGKGKGVNKPVGPGTGIGQGNGGSNAGGGNAGGNGKGKGPAKFSFCSTTGDFQPDVAAPNAKNYRKDPSYIECVKDPCKVYNGCDVSGDGTVTCTFAPAYDPATSTETISCGVDGTCDETGACIEPTP